MSRNRRTERSRPKRARSWIALAVLCIAFWFSFSLVRGAYRNQNEPRTVPSGSDVSVLPAMPQTLISNAASHQSSEWVSFGEEKGGSRSTLTQRTSQLLKSKTQIAADVPLASPLAPPLPTFAPSAPTAPIPPFAAPTSEVAVTSFASNEFNVQEPALAAMPHLATNHRMAESSANVQNNESSMDGMSNSKSRLVQEDSPLPDTQSTSPFFTVSFGSVPNRIEKTLEEPAARIKATISSHTKPSQPVSTESFSPSSEEEKVVSPNATDLVSSLDDLKFQTPQDVESAASASSNVDRSPTLLPKVQSLEVKFGNAKMLASREPEIVRIRPQVVGVPATLQASSTHDRLTDSIPIASAEVVVPTQDIAILNQSSTGREGQLLATSASNDVAASGSEMPSTKQVTAPLAMAPKVENTVPVFPIRVPAPSSETPSVTVNPYAVTERDSNVTKVRMSDQVPAPVIAPVLEQHAMVKPVDTSIETNPRPNFESSSKNIADDSKNSPLDNLKTRIRKLAPTSNVDLRQSEDGSITVIGSVPDEETAKKILIMVRRTYLVPVQDRLIVQVP